MTGTNLPHGKHLAAFRESGPVRHGVPPAVAGAIVVAVHGRGRSPDFLLEHLVARIEAHEASSDIAQRVAWILPAAADDTWYRDSSMAPIDDNQPDLDDALAVLDAIEVELSAVDPQRVVWAGFSQGACLVLEHVARRGTAWGGVIALTGGMIGPPDRQLRVAGDLTGMPAYFSNGDPDESVPLPRTEETVEAYRAAGADVTLDVFPGRDHEIGDPEIDRAVALLTAVTSASRP